MRHIVKIECNTFTFYTTEKQVICKQHTDFTNTILEEDFPNGSLSLWKRPITKGISEKDNINIAIKQLLKDYRLYIIK